jgi:hypothetical protein
VRFAEEKAIMRLQQVCHKPVNALASMGRSSSLFGTLFQRSAVVRGFLRGRGASRFMIF